MTAPTRIQTIARCTSCQRLRPCEHGASFPLCDECRKQEDTTK